MSENYGLGRPSKYKKKYCKMVIDHMKTGRCLTSFAASIDVCKKTVYNWTKEYPEFLHAVSIAKTKCEAWWSDKGLQYLTIHKDDGLFFNGKLWQFNMAARFDWTDRVEVIENNDPEDDYPEV